MERPLLIDLYCGAGGASVGYHRAGFRVVGVDKHPQPRYPFEFYQGDAIKVGARLIDRLRPAAVAASPSCKFISVIRHTIPDGAKIKDGHLNMIPATRELLAASGLPYVIENVPGAPLLDPVVLCGSMFDGLFVRRHRLFELGGWKAEQPACDHKGQAARSPGFIVKRYHSGRPVSYVRAVVGVYGNGNGSGPGDVARWRSAMGIEWMVRDELSQAIPPAYTEHLGRQLIAQL